MLRWLLGLLSISVLVLDRKVLDSVICMIWLLFSVVVGCSGLSVGRLR